VSLNTFPGAPTALLSGVGLGALTQGLWMPGQNLLDTAPAPQLTSAASSRPAPPTQPSVADLLPLAPSA
jgi:hypothetical protein